MINKMKDEQSTESISKTMSDNQSKISSSLGGDLDMSGLVSQAKFIHLRTHSAYSLLEGALRVKTLTESCLKMDMPAIAVTDRNNLFGVLDIANSLRIGGGAARLLV